MAMNWPTFFKRTVSAIIFGIVMLSGLLWNHFSFFILALLIQVLCTREYFLLYKKIRPEIYFPGFLYWLTQLAGILLSGTAYIVSVNPGSPGILVPFLLCLPVVILLVNALGKKGSLDAALIAFGAVFYIMLPVAMLVLMRFISLIVPLSLILMIWINDTMAYIVGSFIGKTPFSSISPKKTWEGTIGGALLTIAAAATWGLYTSYYNTVDWIVLAVCAAIAGTAGDLLESKLKRMADVKDSGTILPGHGGALDRFDSLLVATPFAFCYAVIFMPDLPVTIF